MPQPEAPGSQAIGIADAEPSCCPVCMEPPEWVAAGPCGHHEVCVDCAVRMRFFQDDRRCCICKVLCPTVVITRGSSSNASSSQEQSAGFPKPPPAFGGAGRVGMHYWYHGGTAAYFDDPEQYEAVRKMCFNPPRPVVEDDGAESPRGAPGESSCPRRLGCFLMYMVILTSNGVGMGMYIARAYLSHWHHSTAVAAVLCGLLYAACAYIVWRIR